MQNYLQQILTESNTIIIPGLGALTITSTKTGDIYFMPFLKHDDGTLAKYIAKVEGIELVDAKNTISNFVANIQSSLENGGNYEMEGFGHFLINKDGEIDFQRWEDYQIKDIAISILSKKINERKLNTEKTQVPKSPTTPIETPIVKKEPTKIEEPIKTDIEIHEQLEAELPISVNPIEEPATHQAITAQKSIDELLNDTEHAADSMQSEPFLEPVIISNEFIIPIEDEVSDSVDTNQEQEEIKTLEEPIEAPEREILAQADPSLDNIPPTIIETKEDKKALRKKQKSQQASAKVEEKRLKKIAKLEAKTVAKEAEISAPKEKKKSRSMIFWLFFAILITAGTMWYIKTQRDSKVHLTVIDKKASKIVTTKVIEKKELHKEIAKHSTKDNTSDVKDKKSDLLVEKEKTIVKKELIPVKPVKEAIIKKENIRIEKKETKTLTNTVTPKVETPKNTVVPAPTVKPELAAKGNVKNTTTPLPSVKPEISGSAAASNKNNVTPKTTKLTPAQSAANAVVITSSTPIIKPVPAPPKPVVANANPGYTSQNKNIQVIVGTFKDKASADQFVSNLKADGFTTAFQKEKNGTFEVNLGKFTTLSETSKALQKYRGVKK